MVTINIGRKELFFFVGVLVLIVGAGLGVAYGGSQPDIVGHSAGEMDINISGEIKSLQQAYDDGNLSSSSGGCISCYWSGALGHSGDGGASDDLYWCCTGGCITKVGNSHGEVSCP